MTWHETVLLQERTQLLTDQPLDDLRHKRQIGHWSVV